MIISGPPLRFLVVDDDDIVRTTLVRMLQRLRHHVDSVRDGVEAIEALAVDRYDYLLLDLRLPRMPGEDVMRWLQQHPQWSGALRVVVITALPVDDRKRLEELGAHAVLQKPLPLAELRDLVARKGTA